MDSDQTTPQSDDCSTVFAFHREFKNTIEDNKADGSESVQNSVGSRSPDKSV